jgi:hypothetical protein
MTNVLARRVPIGLRRYAAPADPRVVWQHAAAVGAPAPGFAILFPGWNVWSIYQAEDPVEGIGDAIFNAGMSLDRRLKVWIESQITEHAPAAAVQDPANPAALKGDQVEIIPNAGGLTVAQGRAEAGFGGAQQVGEKDSKALERFVRFYNRGAETVLAWPHDENYLLNAVYQPDRANALTSGAPPFSLGGAASGALDKAGDTLKLVAVGAGVAIAAAVVIAIVKAKKAA